MHIFFNLLLVIAILFSDSKTNSTNPQTNLQLSKFSGDSLKAQSLASLLLDSIPNANSIIKEISCQTKEKSCQILFEKNAIKFNEQNIAILLAQCPKLIYNQNRKGALFVFAFVNKSPTLVCVAKFDAQLEQTNFAFKIQGHGIVQNIKMKGI